MNISFKNRIALYYMMATAIIMAVIFSAIYIGVHQTVMLNLDEDLAYEAEKHTHEIVIQEDSIHFINKAEWEEREHREIQVNPVFIQLIDVNGRLMDKSPNLKYNQLSFKDSKVKEHFDSKLSNRSIRQVQLPVYYKENINGYILAAMSSESAESVILKLQNVLILSFLIILSVLYFVSRFIAGRGIRPIKEVTKTIARITNKNLTQRVALPQNKDEIYELSYSFNDLLERIEMALERERQFTSDASHELRTPLAAIRGTLEVLIRKKRSTDDYEEKIKFALTEIDRMSNTIEQLLLLARLDEKSANHKSQHIDIETAIQESISHFTDEIAQKNIRVEVDFNSLESKKVPHYYSSLIFNNVIGNAIKYSYDKSSLRISVEQFTNELHCIIVDQGIGIKSEDLKQIFGNFFRSDSLNHKHIKGNGLGLSIAKKCADAIHATIEITSTLKKGTSVTVVFKLV